MQTKFLEIEKVYQILLRKAYFSHMDGMTFNHDAVYKEVLKETPEILLSVWRTLCREGEL